MNKQLLDVIIIGGGPAGLNAALVLGRAKKNVALIDEALPRNRVTRETHGFLTRDGISPSEFRRIAKEEISSYPSVINVTDTVLSIKGEDGQFQVETKQGQTLTSKKILFAVGMKDRPLNIPGLVEVYGKSAFVCPFCDGWELRDEPLVIIMNGPETMQFVPLISGWSDKLTVCTNGPAMLSATELAELKEHQVLVLESPIQHIHSHDGIVQQVVLEDGTTVPCRGIFFKPELVPGSDLPRTIGCQIGEYGEVVVDDFGQTNVPGVFSAGDVATQMHSAIAAASMGSIAAAIITKQLNTEAWGGNNERYK